MQNTLSCLAAWIFLLCLSFLTLYCVLSKHENNLQLIADYTTSILQGKPAWIAYQNRLLAPFLIYLLETTGLSNTESLAVLLSVTLLLTNFLLYGLLRRLDISIIASVGGVVAFCALFVFFQDSSWLYLWDFLDLVIFSLFGFMVIRNSPIGCFVALFLVALLNRESALFIAAYLVIRGTQINLRPFQIQVICARTAVIGAVLGVFGALYTKAIRDFLFISQLNGKMDVRHAFMGNHFYLLKNLQNLFITNFTSSDAFNSLWLLGTAWLVMAYYHQFNKPQKDLGLTFLVILANTLVFGFINETRMYFIHFPLLIFLFLPLIHLMREGYARSSAKRQIRLY